MAIELPARIPPHDLDAEHAVLGAAMMEPEVPAMLAERLDPADFYSRHHDTIFRRIVGLHAAGQPVDRITLAAELRAQGELDEIGGLPKLAQLEADAHVASYVPTYVSLILEASALRTIGALGEEAQRSVLSTGTTSEVLMERLRTRLTSLERRLTTAGKVTLPMFRWVDLVRREREKLIYVWPGWLVTGKVVLVAGAGDSMKSFLALFVGAMIAAGRPALEPDGNDNPCLAGPVLIVSAENGIDEDTRRVQLLHRGHALPDDLPLTVMPAEDLALKDPATWSTFTTAVNELRPALIAIDSGIAVADLENENDNASVAKFMKTCVQPLARVYGATVLLIVHSPKPPTQRGSLPFTDEHVARGASAWRNQADGVLYLKRDKSLGPDAAVLRTAKVRTGFRHPPVWFRIETTEKDEQGQPLAVQVRYGGEFTEETGQASEAAAALAKAIPAAIAILKATPGVQIKRLHDALEAGGISQATARRAVAVLRGEKDWPSGPYKGKAQAVVDEAKGKGRQIFLTFNPSIESALGGPAPDDDEVPF